MGRRALRPGEIALGTPCPAGHIPYERIDEQGEIEHGVLERVVDGQPNPNAQFTLRMGAEVAPGVRKVVSLTRVTSGPAQVSSAAYRAGWDDVFARRRAKPGSDKAN